MQIILDKFFRICLFQLLFARGAISYGDYVFDEKTNTVLGAAITDCANWYESTDFIGIYTTPKCYFLMQSLKKYLEENETDSVFNERFVEYDIPIKNSNSLKDYCINWVYEFKKFVENYSKKIKENHTVLNKISDIFSMVNIPKGTESKYFNTLKFVEYCVNILNKNEEQKNSQI